MSNVLISSSPDALTLGVDTQSLRELAGLGHREESEAQDLLRQVKDELGLAATIRRIRSPRDGSWCVDGLVRWSETSEVGARLIWDFAWVELDFPPAQQPIVGEISKWEDRTPDCGNEQEHYQRRIVVEIDSLLVRPWPPTT